MWFLSFFGIFFDALIIQSCYTYFWGKVKALLSKGRAKRLQSTISRSILHAIGEYHLILYNWASSHTVFTSRLEQHPLCLTFRKKPLTVSRSYHPISIGGHLQNYAHDYNHNSYRQETSEAFQSHNFLIYFKSLLITLETPGYPPASCTPRWPWIRGDEALNVAKRGVMRWIWAWTGDMWFQKEIGVFYIHRS